MSNENAVLKDGEATQNQDEHLDAEVSFQPGMKAHFKALHFLSESLFLMTLEFPLWWQVYKAARIHHFHPEKNGGHLPVSTLSHRKRQNNSCSHCAFILAQAAYSWHLRNETIWAELFSHL